MEGGTRMLRLKSCPKCKNGDVAFDRDYLGCYEYCIQCGYYVDLESTIEALEQRRKRKTTGDSPVGVTTGHERSVSLNSY